MAKSMTGFGRASSKDGKKLIFSVEVKSINHRYLDVNVRLPKNLVSLENNIRKEIAKKINRGKIDVAVNYKNYNDNNSSIKLNVAKCDEYMEILNQIKSRYNIKDDITVSMIADYPDVIVTEENEEDLNEIWNELDPVLNEAIDMNLSMRTVEGDKLKEDIKLKCSVIKQKIQLIEEDAKLSSKKYEERLYEKIKEFASDVNIDENRIATEVAIFADKVDIDEEITRFYSHLNQMNLTLDLNEPIGRKMDFIVQEMNREANTIASKSIDIEITNLVIDIKNVIEKIREQIQNIE